MSSLNPPSSRGPIPTVVATRVSTGDLWRCRPGKRRTSWRRGSRPSSRRRTAAPDCCRRPQLSRRAQRDVERAPLRWRHDRRGRRWPTRWCDKGRSWARAAPCGALGGGRRHRPRSRRRARARQRDADAAAETSRDGRPADPNARSGGRAAGADQADRRRAALRDKARLVPPCLGAATGLDGDALHRLLREIGRSRTISDGTAERCSEGRVRMRVGSDRRRQRACVRMSLEARTGGRLRHASGREHRSARDPGTVGFPSRRPELPQPRCHGDGAGHGRRRRGACRAFPIAATAVQARTFAIVSQRERDVRSCATELATRRTRDRFACDRSGPGPRRPDAHRSRGRSVPRVHRSALNFASPGAAANRTTGPVVYDVSFWRRSCRA